MVVPSIVRGGELRTIPNRRNQELALGHAAEPILG
jgi:hypothetical protein